MSGAVIVRSAMRNLFAGARISHVDVVDVASITPDEFFRKYVAPRTPCLLTGALPHSALHTWTLPRLRARAAHTTVEVEHREVRVVSMSIFGDFNLHFIVALASFRRNPRLTGFRAGNTGLGGEGR